MGLFGNKEVKRRCDACHNVTVIDHPDYSYGFFCRKCGARLYWDSRKKKMETNSERAFIETEKKIRRLKSDYTKHDIEMEKLKQKKEKDDIKLSFFLMFFAFGFLIIMAVIYRYL